MSRVQLPASVRAVRSQGWRNEALAMKGRLLGLTPRHRALQLMGVWLVVVLGSLDKSGCQSVHDCVRGESWQDR